eukprot:13980375-Alexandrium_andersonii.AAC.1
MSDIEGLPNTIDASRHDDTARERFVHLRNALGPPSCLAIAGRSLRLPRGSRLPFAIGHCRQDG